MTGRWTDYDSLSNELARIKMELTALTSPTPGIVNCYRCNYRAYVGNTNSALSVLQAHWNKVHYTSSGPLILDTEWSVNPLPSKIEPIRIPSKEITRHPTDKDYYYYFDKFVDTGKESDKAAMLKLVTPDFVPDLSRIWPPDPDADLIHWNWIWLTEVFIFLGRCFADVWNGLILGIMHWMDM